MTISAADRTEAPGQREPILVLRAISKHFGAVAALDQVDLELYRGEVLALVGDNGAGKSTLVKILAGVHAPSAGTISFEGKPRRLHGPQDARNLGIETVFQDLALCENLSVVGNLFLGRELSPLRLNEVEMEVRCWELLKQLSAKLPSARVPVAALSGGQRQTVAIARSLLGDPKVILLDEPTAALGVEQTAEVLNLIERLRQRQLGVIMVSHNIEDVQAVADRVAVLRLGRNNGTFDVQTTTPEQIVTAITGAHDNVVARRQAARKTSSTTPARSQP